MLLFVVAIVNLNVVPSISASGGMTVWLWLISLVFFFWPQGIAVVELSHRYPGEGGIYLWTKKIFGDFHGFLSGWCYWTNNIFYVPTVVLDLPRNRRVRRWTECGRVCQQSVVHACSPHWFCWCCWPS